MEATTTRASTVIRSMPTSETRTQASMTMPLSRTRSRTSMRLVPPAARSTAMLCSCCRAPLPLATGRRPARRQRLDLALELPHLHLQLRRVQLTAALAARRQVPVVPPPIETNLLRFVERAHEQPDPDGEELDFGEGNLDVAGDDQPLVQHAIEDVHESG